MRLRNVESGHRLPQAALLRALRRVTGFEAPDVMKVFMYRPEIFGAAFCPLAEEALRRSRAWSAGELELFGAFASKLNQCRF